MRGRASNLLLHDGGLNRLDGPPRRSIACRLQAERWRKRLGDRSAGALWLPTGFLFSAAGVYTIFFWAATRFGNAGTGNATALSSDAFKQEYQGAEQRLFAPSAGIHRKEIPRAELVMTAFPWRAGFSLSHKNPPNLGFFLPTSI